MPKKKLTKLQVRRKMLTATNALYALVLDKFKPDSKVPLSFNAIVKMHDQLAKAERRLAKQ
tara:strand:- start:68 stop:250 length:183 start_codon:yes stop_codon:yes gene_type:complete